MRKTLRVASGFALCILGIVGIILPIMPGWIFLIPGLMILAEDFPWARALLRWARRRLDRARGRESSQDGPDHA